MCLPLKPGMPTPFLASYWYPGPSRSSFCSGYLRVILGLKRCLTPDQVATNVALRDVRKPMLDRPRVDYPEREKEHRDEDVREGEKHQPRPAPLQEEVYPGPREDGPRDHHEDHHDE